MNDLEANGLVDFSLRRAARAAGTTHKVLLYHFASVDALLVQAVLQLRARRITNAVAAAARRPDGPLSDRVRSIWPALVGERSRILDQAIGLTMYDPDRYGDLGRGASAQYLPALLALCPAHWPQQRKREVSTLILAAMRGFLIDRLVSDGDADVGDGLAALARALDREEAAG